MKTISRRTFVRSSPCYAAASALPIARPALAELTEAGGQAISDQARDGELHIPQFQPCADDQLHEATEDH